MLLVVGMMGIVNQPLHATLSNRLLSWISPQVTGRTRPGKEGFEGVPPTSKSASKWVRISRDERLEASQSLERVPIKEIPVLVPPVMTSDAVPPSLNQATCRLIMRCRYLNVLKPKPRRSTRTLTLCGDQSLLQ